MPPSYPYSKSIHHRWWPAKKISERPMLDHCHTLVVDPPLEEVDKIDPPSKDLVFFDASKHGTGFEQAKNRAVEYEVPRLLHWMYAGLRYDWNKGEPDVSGQIFVTDMPNWCLTSLYPRWTLYGSIQWLLKLKYYPPGYKAERFCKHRSCCNPWHHHTVKSPGSDLWIVAHDGIIKFGQRIKQDHEDEVRLQFDFDHDLPLFRRKPGWTLPYNDSEGAYTFVRDADH